MEQIKRGFSTFSRGPRDDCNVLTLYVQLKKEGSAEAVNLVRRLDMEMLRDDLIFMPLLQVSMLKFLMSPIS